MQMLIGVPYNILIYNQYYAWQKLIIKLDKIKTVTNYNLLILFTYIQNSLLETNTNQLQWG